MRRSQIPIGYRVACWAGIALAATLGFAACGGGASSTKGSRQVILGSEDLEDPEDMEPEAPHEADQDVKAQLGLIEDPQLVAYVSELGNRLSRHAPRGGYKYKFQIVDQQAPNAFALPGGFIFVSRGLLILINSEDELANVIGHEIVHVAARHSAARQAMGRSLPTGFNWMQGRYLAAFGREQEREADRLGQGLAAVAGYDPEGMANFLQELEKTERLHFGASRLPSFRDTHPLTTRRTTEAGMRARTTSWTRGKPIIGSHEEFLRRMEGLAVGARAAEGTFEGDRFLHADLDLMIRFPAGWTMMNTHRAVGAISPKRDAQVFLEGQGPGDDVEAAAAKYVEELITEGFKVERRQPLKIGPYPAFRVEGRISEGGGWQHVLMTWIHRDGSIFRFTGISHSSAFARYRGTILNVPRSFRPLRPQERESIRETRLRIVVARGGESLSDLSERTSNRWDIQQTAVMNGLFTTATLEAEQLVKIAVAESYAPEDESQIQ